MRRPEWPNSLDELSGGELAAMCFRAAHHAITLAKKGDRLVDVSFDSQRDKNGGGGETRDEQWELSDPNRELSAAEIAEVELEAANWNPELVPVTFEIAIRLPHPTDPEATLTCVALRRLLSPGTLDSPME